MFVKKIEEFCLVGSHHMFEGKLFFASDVRSVLMYCTIQYTIIAPYFPGFLKSKQKINRKYTDVTNIFLHETL
jgi:hypothetical protein